MMVTVHQEGIIIAQIAKWEKITATFYRTGDWLYGMHYIVSLYKGTNRFVTRFLKYSKEERKSLLSLKITDIATKYHKMIMDCIVENKSQLDKFELSLEFDDYIQ